MRNAPDSHTQQEDDAMTADRVAVLEVMVEMLTAHDMMRDRDPDQALNDYRDVAVMMLAQRHADEEMDGLLDVFDERLAKIRQGVEIARRQMVLGSH